MEKDQTLQQTMQQLLARMYADREERKADRIAHREFMRQMVARADDNSERDREDLKEMMVKIRAETDAIRAETKAIHQRRMAKLDAHQERTMAHQEATETEPDPRMMQSIDEHQEIPKEGAAVMPVRDLMKRRRVCNLATERRQKRKESTRRSRGSRRKSAAACRKVSRRAKVAWRESNLFRNVQTQRNCGPRKRLTVTAIRTTRCAKVARHKERSHEGPSVEQGRRKNKTRNKIGRGTRRGRMLGRRELMRQEGTNETRNRDFKEQLRLGNERTTR
jgi:hypothetical protein